MFKPGTLLIIGAGTSRELGFPLGSELKAEIASKLHWDMAPVGHIVSDAKPTNLDFYQLVYGSPHPSKTKKLQPTPNDKLIDQWRTWQQIRDGLPFASSIDAFLDMRRGDPELIRVAKCAICSTIADSEKKLLKPWPGPSSNSLSQWLLQASPDKKQASPAWTTRFSEICFSGAELNQVPEALQRLSIISFNYDRLVEQFTRIAIRSLYGVNDQESHNLAKHLKVIHPYGSLGQLGLDQNDVQWGTHGKDVANNSGIITFAERLAQPFMRSEISELVSSAARIVFLGFGFHSQNVELLKGSVQSDTKIIGTSFGMSEWSVAAIKSRLINNLGLTAGVHPAAVESRIQMHQMICSDFLEFARVELSA